MPEREDAPLPAVEVREVEVWDPFVGRHWRGDVRMVQGRITGQRPPEPREVVNGRGLWLIPATLDLHAHVEELTTAWSDVDADAPEDLASAAAAAVAGGLTGLAVMPDARPRVDHPAVVQAVGDASRRLGLARLWPLAALSPAQRPGTLTPLAGLAAVGAVGFWAGVGEVSTAGLRAALTYVRGLGRPVLEAPLDRQLAGDGVMHEGTESARLGLPGVPAAAEAAAAWRDVQVAALAGGPLHLTGVSAPGTLEALAWARAHQVPVTADLCPLHLLLGDEAVGAGGYHAGTKIWPPLRPAELRAALRQAVIDGTVTVLASHHTPNRREATEADFVAAPFGASDLETAVAAAATALLGDDESGMDPLRFWGCWTVGPHRVLGLSHPGVVEGAPADWVLWDPNARWRVDPAGFRSRGRNTPLAGRQLKGRPVATMVAGRWRMRDGEVLP